ncbi:MAG: DUF1150 family protein [Hyphomonas sp.]|uniref:DUF1150 family protein n=1 Tax=Hyphomonas sp. TaxID=87 RepID=UPI00352773B6
MLNDENLNPFERETFVYIRHLDADEVRDMVPPNALEGVTRPEDLFVVSSADGERLAIVEGREAAFAAARMHDLKPLSVH